MNSRSLFALPWFVLIAIAVSADAQTQMIDASQFQAPHKDSYSLDSGDTLGVFVEGVVGEVNSMPPVHQPQPGSDLPPAMGFPTLVLHDGTIRLPIVDPISVRGLSVVQVESLLKKIFMQGDKPVITDRSRIIVSLIRKRTVNVTVVRGDQSEARSDPRFRRSGGLSGVNARSDGSGQILNLQLPAGDNDLLNAMMQSGGLPGVNAKDNLLVHRNIAAHRASHTDFPRTGRESYARYSQSFPLRSAWGSSYVQIPAAQTQLGNGDIVTIESKPTEVYYTGGLLGGGEFPIPRDRPLSVMEAISLAGGIPQERAGFGAIPLQQPGSLTLLRRCGDQQVMCHLDLRGGFSQQANQTRVRSGDFLILDYSPAQRVQNVGIGVLSVYGIRELFRD